MTGERPRILALFGGVVLFGQERGNIEALAALQEKGCQVLCLVSDAAWNEAVPRALDERGLAWKRVPYVRFRIRGRFWRFLLLEWWAFLRANLLAAAVNRQFRATHVHVMSPTYLLNFWLFLLWHRELPVVYRAGDEPPFAGALAPLWRMASRRVTRFVANSKFVRASLARSGVRSPIELIYNAPPIRPNVRRSGDGEQWAPGTMSFIYVGQIAEHKGVGLLVDAMQRVSESRPDARLTIVGRIDEHWSGDEWARRLRARVLENEGLRARITFLGYREDVPTLIGAAGALVVPSIWNDPFPNVVMEAKAVGRPAIVFPRGGLPEMIRHGVDGMICPDATVNALAEAMQTYLDQPTLAASQGKAARLSLERFGIDRFAERWMEVYITSSGGTVPASELSRA